MISLPILVQQEDVERLSQYLVLYSGCLSASQDC